MTKVKCPVCGQLFDKDKVPTVIYSSRRYAHQECAPTLPLYIPPQKPEKQLSAEQVEKKECEDYIKNIFGLSTLTTRIKKQLKDYIEKGMTYNNIRLTLIYWFEVRKEDIEKAHQGIGIVPYIYKEAEDYYKVQLVIARAAREEGKKIEVESEIVFVNRPKSIRQKKSFLDGVLENES